jgi:hypothetical protein
MAFSWSSLTSDQENSRLSYSAGLLTSMDQVNERNATNRSRLTPRRGLRESTSTDNQIPDRLQASGQELKRANLWSLPLELREII